MAVLTACPTEQTLQGFLLGHNTPAEAAALEAHLEACEICVAKFSMLRADDSLVSVMRCGSSPAEQTMTEGDGLLAGWLKQLRLGTVTGAHPAAEISVATTLDEAPPSRADAGATAPYSFLAPARGPHELGRLGRYQVRQVLGSGGMGVVFQAYDPDLQRPVALKTALPAWAENPSAKQRFLREARAAAAIKHDHIVTIYDVSEDHGIAYLAMELLEGESLDQKMHRVGRLPWQEALCIARESAQGLAAAHQHGLIHRDIKPGNIWLETRSEGRQAKDGTKLASPPASLASRVKILDFGLALPTADNANLTISGAIVGTPAFMAPEQCRGQTVDARSDLFSLGCVMYRMVTGEAPFRGAHPISTLIAVATTSPRPPQEINPELPSAVCALIMRLLSKDPANRPSSAAAVIASIEAIEHDCAEPAKQTRRSRRPLGWAIAATILVCALGLAGYLGSPASKVPDGEGVHPIAHADDKPTEKSVFYAGKEPKQFFEDQAHPLGGILDFRDIAGATLQELRDWADQLGPNFRISLVTNRRGKGPTLFNAVAVRETAPLPFRFFPEVSRQEEKEATSLWDIQWRDGYRPVSLCAYCLGDDSGPWTDAWLWVKATSCPNWFGSKEFVFERVEAAKTANERPTYLDGAMLANGPMYRILQPNDQGRKWAAALSLNADELIDALHFYKQKGWRPDVLAPHWDAGQLQFMLVAVDNVEQVDWRFRMDMTLEQYKQESTVQREKGLFPLALASYGDDVEVRYTAIWVRCRGPRPETSKDPAPDAQTLADRAANAVSWTGAARKGLYADEARALTDVLDFRELIGGTSTELRDWHEKLDPSFRVAFVTSRKGAGPTLFNAVAVETKTPVPARFEIDVDQETIDNQSKRNAEDGYRPVAACANLSANQKRSWNNTLLWVKTADKRYMNWYGSLQNIIDQNKNKKTDDFRTIYLDGTVFPEEQRFNTIMSPSHGRAWEVRYTLTSDEMFATLEACKRKGWRPDVIAPYGTDANLRYMLVVVDNSDQVNWRFRTDMSRTDCQKESAQQKREGLFPLSIVSHGNDADIRYAAIFVRYRAPAKD